MFALFVVFFAMRSVWCVVCLFVCCVLFVLVVLCCLFVFGLRCVCLLRVIVLCLFALLDVLQRRVVCRLLFVTLLFVQCSCCLFCVVCLL